MPRFRNAAIAVLLCTVATPASYAQILYGSLTGRVTDPSGAAVSSATVNVTNKQTGAIREVKADAAGTFDVPNLQAGIYDVKVSATGFQTYLRTDVAVTINTVHRVDAALQLGQVTETVTVGAESVVLQTDRSEVRQEVNSRELVNLPVASGRNYQQLFRVLPGFTPPGNAHSVPTNPTRALVFNVNGASRTSNNTRLDGASSTHIQLPHIVAYTPALEAIETVNIVSNSFDAEQGLAGGVAINVSTKSGTNDLHGSLSEYHTNNHLKARPFFLPASQGKPKLVYNQWGGAIGGPIRKNKVFYFANYETTYDRRNAQLFGTVPNALMKAGNLSASPTQLYDPATGDSTASNRLPLSGNLIPASRTSSITRRLADLTPLPNLRAANDPFQTQNFFGSAPFLFDRRTVDSKVNWNVSQKLTTFVRLSILRYNSTNPQLFGELAGPPVFDGSNPGKGDGGTYSSTVGGTYVMSPSLVIDAYFGYTRIDTSSQQPRLDEKLGLDLLKIPGTNGTRSIEGGWPRFAFGAGGLTTIGIAEDFMPYFRRDPQYQYVANFNWTRSTHSIRFGFDFYNQHLNQVQPEIAGVAYHGGSGGFTFDGGPTALRGGPSVNVYNSYGSFLLGLPVRAGKILVVPDEYALRAHLYSFYVRDRWNVSPKLTLNYGIRYEYFPVPVRPDRGIERYDPDTNKMLICGLGQAPKDCGISVSKAKFAPRFGLAYRATSSFIVRAGYGITNDPFQGTELLRANYPLLIAQNIDGPNSFLTSGRIEDGIPVVRPPDLGNGIIDIPGVYAVGTLPKDFKRGYIQSWNLTLQKDVGWGFVAQAAYIGTREINKLGYLDINSGQVIGAGNAGRPLNQRFGRNSATTMVVPHSTGQYNGLQLSLDRRFAKGLQLNVNYTWSKSIGIIDNSDSQPPVRAWAYYSRNRSVRGFDRTNVAHVSAIYELPFGKGKPWATSGWASHLIGGWQVNNLFSLYSGLPFTISAPGTSLDLPGSSQTADQVNPYKVLGGIGSGALYFDPTSFAAVTAARFGTAGFNQFRGPGLVNWDFGVFRFFKITERWSAQFRMESFNFSNTPHFGNPGGAVGNVNLGRITGVTNLARENIDERQFRFGLRIGF
ncbi:MAG: TonB-dependent receptor [Acidobacteria bacterium]|nr:TonB-dependent receptor [Acidobacteriota bacterium]